MKSLTRRTFLQGMAAGSLALAGGCRTPDPAGPRNVLFISIDDLNDWIQPLRGYRGKVFTPHMNRLAKSGMLFTNAHCSGPLCNPSRSSLMTGLSPVSCGIISNTENFRDKVPQAKTIPLHFANHGYSTAASGKIFHNRFPDVRSWQEYFETPQRRYMKGRPLNGQLKGREFRELPPVERMLDWGAIDFGASNTPDGKVVDWAIEYLGREHTAPIFLGVGLVGTHLPWYLPQSFFDLYPLQDILLPAVREDDAADLGEIARRWQSREIYSFKKLTREDWKLMAQAYLAAVSFVDSQLGRLLKVWEESPYSDNAVVMLWSDHGFHIGEKHHFRKASLWEESTKVPLIVSAPGVEPGTRCRKPVSLLDLYPTLCDLCDLPKRKELEGNSFVDLLADPEGFRPWPAITTRQAYHHAVRTERYRYIRYSNNDEELYDHKTDPQEWRNLIGNPEFEQIRLDHRRWLRNPEGAYNKAKRDRKKALKEQAAQAEAAEKAP